MWKWINELDERDNCTIDNFDELTDVIVETMNDCGYFSKDEIYDTRDKVKALNVGEKEYIVSGFGNLRIQILKVS